MKMKYLGPVVRRMTDGSFEEIPRSEWTGVHHCIWQAGSQNKFAQDMGVWQSTVSAWVRRGYMPVKYVREAEALYGVDRRELIDPRLRELFRDLDVNYEPSWD